MSVRRYEISDEQWEQIKDMFTRAKTGRPPKNDRVMFNAILWLARSGVAWQISLNDIDLIKLFIVASANGVMMVLCCVFLRH